MQIDALAVCVFTLLLLVGCQSGTTMQGGGFKFVHFNNPECMGTSASGVVLVDETDSSIVKSDIAQKTGYCEAITGQVITSTGEALKGYTSRLGSVKNSTSTQTNPVTTIVQPEQEDTQPDDAPATSSDPL